MKYLSLTTLMVPLLTLSVASCLPGQQPSLPIRTAERVQPGSDVTAIPIIEDVQPSGLKKGEIWLGLPLDRIVAFRGDVATLPLKVAGGPGTKEEVLLSVNIMPRSDQKPLKLGSDPVPPAHWVNGYAPSVAAEGAELSTTARLTFGVPFTKYLRMPIPDDSPTGVYLLEVAVEGKRSGLRRVGHVRLAIHAGSHFVNLPVSVEGKEVVAEIRDDQGNPKRPMLAYLQGTGRERDVVLLLQPSEPKGARHAAPLHDIDVKQYKWKLVVIKRGYRHYQEPVTF